MAIYRYKAKTDPQNTIEGNLEAGSEKEAIEKISLLGYIPVSLEIETNPGQSAANAGFKTAVSGARVRSREITVFSRQLASLLKSGVPILKAINIIKEQAANQVLKAVLKDVYKEVEGGKPFSSVLSQYPRMFPALYISMIKAGENTGALPEVLLRIAEYRAKQEELTSRIRMAMAYPILMAFVGLGTIIFMLTFVMPRLMKLYSDMGQSLPVATKILIAAAKTFQQSWFFIILIFAAAIFLLTKYLKTKMGRMSWSFIQLNMPVFSGLFLKIELARFSRTLELLLRSGISILRALNITIPILGNEIIKNQIFQSLKDLEQGGSLGKSLWKSKLIPSFMGNLIIVGEESGRLDDALTELAASYERDTEEAIRIMSSLLEPLMILVMGLIVGFVVIAMLLPIFEINVMVR